jgi:hypothetical protein
MSDWFAGGGGSPVDVAKVLDGQGVVEAFGEIINLGALLSLGTTSDGGALGVTITVDGRWRRQYVREPEELSDWLKGAVQGVADAIERPPSASNAPRQRQRRTRAG